MKLKACPSASSGLVILGYSRWENFLNALDKARKSCNAAGEPIADHFVGLNKMVTLGSGAQREVEDIALTRYACYLVAQNGDPAKPAIAFAQTYFAVQTRKQEIIEQRLLEVGPGKADQIGEKTVGHYLRAWCGWRCKKDIERYPEKIDGFCSTGADAAQAGRPALKGTSTIWGTGRPGGHRVLWVGRWLMLIPQLK
ncbi:BRO family protein [Niabella hirudinis]|uniref:BRO family protein n=1 Tax=Niabella hirudinis TaxID=1285929 RepID=UPI003EB97DE9